MSKQGLRQQNESYADYDPRTGKGGNLLGHQRRWAQVYFESVGQRQPDAQWSHAVHGFKKVRGPGDDRISPFSSHDETNTIVPLSQIRKLHAVPIRKELIEKPGDIRQADGYYRLHVVEQVGQIVDGEVCFGVPPTGNRRPNNANQYDGFKRPLQNHQVYKNTAHDPASVGGAIPGADTLRSPYAGKFSVIRNELHIRITVNGNDIYRFMLRDADAVECVLEKGEVAVNEPVVRMTRAVPYQVAQYHKDGTPKRDIIRGDVLCANKLPQMQFLLHTTESLLDCVHNPPGSMAGRMIVPTESYMPIPIAAVGEASLHNRRDRGWQPNRLLRAKILLGVSAKSAYTDDAFHITAPMDGLVTAVTRHRSYVVIRIESGKDVHNMMVPTCAEMAEGFRYALVYEREELEPTQIPAEGREVVKGEILGDYVPRGFYAGYDEVRDVAADGIVAIEDAYLDKIAIRPGERGFLGCQSHASHHVGLGFDARVIGSLNNDAVDYYLDMRPCMGHVDNTYGIAMFPPYEFSIEDLASRVNGIFYNATPTGSRFAGLENAIDSMNGSSGRGKRRNRPSKSRRNRRKRQKSAA